MPATQQARNGTKASVLFGAAANIVPASAPTAAAAAAAAATPAVTTVAHPTPSSPNGFAAAASASAAAPAPAARPPLPASSAATGAQPTAPAITTPPPPTRRPHPEPESRSLDLNFVTLVPGRGKFQRIPRISATAAPEEIARKVKEHLEVKGLPLVIENIKGARKSWSEAGFDLDTFRELSGGSTQILVRNLLAGQDLQVRVDDLLNYARLAKPHIQSHDTSRLYGKDLKCPRDWRDWVMEMVPPEVAYQGEEDATSSLHAHQRPESLVCSFGPGDTWTPFRRDLCSSIGQNLMTCADPGSSSIWFVTSTHDSNDAEKYLEKLGHSLRPEGYCLSVQELEAAPFPIYVCDQQVGDLVLLPSRAMHQAINRGGRTMKVAWSRLTVSTLEMTMHEDLPLYQRYCQKETFRVKAVIEASLRQAAWKLPDKPHDVDDTLAIERHTATIETVRTLLLLYEQILVDEYDSEWRSHAIIGSPDAYVECDFCGAHVLQSFFECPEGNTLCSMCYCQGRLCSCSDPLALKPSQLHPFDVRLEIRNNAVRQLNKTLAEPLPLLTERNLVESSFPRSYTAACRLLKMRESPDVAFATCRICKGVLNNTSRYKCRPCHCSYCFGCLLFRFYIHPVYALAQDHPERFHDYHKGGSKQDYDEWKADPESYRVEARVNFNLIEAALTNLRCRPVVPECKLGFLDQTDEYPKGLSGTLPPPPLACDTAKSKQASKRQIDGTASPTVTNASGTKRPRKSSPGPRGAVHENTPVQSNGNGKAASVAAESLPTTPANGKAPLTPQPAVPPAAAAAVAPTRPAPSAAPPKTVPVAPAAAPPVNGQLASVLPSISEIFNLLDKENKKRELLAQQRHLQLVQLIQDQANKSNAQYEDLAKRLRTIEAQMDDLLGDISRGAETQAHAQQGGEVLAITSNVRGARDDE
ncbi:hypothetical protein ACQY0O_001869 [Thecaphora frezii]